MLFQNNDVSFDWVNCATQDNNTVSHLIFRTMAFNLFLTNGCGSIALCNKGEIPSLTSLGCMYYFHQDIHVYFAFLLCPAKGSWGTYLRIKNDGYLVHEVDHILYGETHCLVRICYLSGAHCSHAL